MFRNNTAATVSAPQAASSAAESCVSNDEHICISSDCLGCESDTGSFSIAMLFSFCSAWDAVPGGPKGGEEDKDEELTKRSWILSDCCDGISSLTGRPSETALRFSATLNSPLLLLGSPEMRT